MIKIKNWSSINPYLKSAIFGLLAFISVFVVTSSPVIALTFSFLVTVITTIAAKRTNNKRSDSMSAAWPEVIDHLVTGIQSGLSIMESLIGLSTRGPEVLRPLFSEFASSMKSRGNFSLSLAKLKIDCAQTGKIGRAHV